MTDPRSRYWVTEYSYDWGNRVTAQYGTTPDGSTDRERPQARMVYDALGNLLSCPHVRKPPGGYCEASF